MCVQALYLLTSAVGNLITMVMVQVFAMARLEQVGFMKQFVLFIFITASAVHPVFHLLRADGRRQLPPDGRVALVSRLHN